MPEYMPFLLSSFISTDMTEHNLDFLVVWIVALCCFSISFPVPHHTKGIALSLYSMSDVGMLLLQVQAWARQHQQRLATALTELLATQELLENLLTWLQWAETNLNDKDKEPLPQEIEEVKGLIADHQVKQNCI